MAGFRVLKADEIEVRINQVSEKYTQLLLYKTARTDANILDETVGLGNWQGDYKAVGDEIYAGIGIWNKELAQWIWKWDTGSAGNFEKEKSEKENLDYMAFYGVGNHGGGPTIKLINEINNLDIWNLLPL
jgi:hypothetical protein